MLYIVNEVVKIKIQYTTPYHNKEEKSPLIDRFSVEVSQISKRPLHSECVGEEIPYLFVA